jgi:transposase
MPHTRFPKEFQDEAVGLAPTSGRSWREVAQDLGVGLSTLCHRIDRRREREIDDPPEDRQDHMAVELNWLRRKNEILHQEPEILKKSAVGSIGQRITIDVNVFRENYPWRAWVDQAYRQSRNGNSGPNGRRAGRSVI